MNALLEAYRGRIGNDYVRQQGNGFNGPCPFCGGAATTGRDRSDRFIVWPDRRDRLGETCTENSIPGVWYCRNCGKTGDTIAFLMEAEGMTFKTACADLGIRGASRRAPKSRIPQPPRNPEPEFTPREWPVKAPDPAKWCAYAAKLHAESRDNLGQNPNTLQWLAARGLDAAAVERYGIGYLPGDKAKDHRIRNRAGIGLEPKTEPDGRVRTLIRIPRGIVIPHFDSAGRVIRLRIRRPQPDIDRWGDKYMVLEGGSSQAMMLEARGPRQLAPYVVVEAELDAMLIHSATGGAVGAFAALTNRGKPDPAQHDLLKEAAIILVALDYDPRQKTRPDGSTGMETPGGQGWEWWSKTYRQAKRWPVPQGKDPGDAYALGVDIRAWINAALPPSIQMTAAPASCGGRPVAPEGCADAQAAGERGPRLIPQAGEPCDLPGAPLRGNAHPGHSSTAPEASPAPPSGPTEPFVAGLQSSGGGGGEFCKAAPPAIRPGPTQLKLQPEEAPASIQALYALWRSVPDFTVTKKEDGGLAFTWNRAWAHACEEHWDRLGELQNVILRGEQEWHWLTKENSNLVIAHDNLLEIQGGNNA